MIWTCTKEVYSLLLYQIKLWWAFCFLYSRKDSNFRFRVQGSECLASTLREYYMSVFGMLPSQTLPLIVSRRLIPYVYKHLLFFIQFSINYFLWSWQDLNLQHTACKTVTLPLSYSPIPCSISRARWETWTPTCWVTTNNSTFELTEPLIFNDWWSIKKPVSFYINKNRGGFILI